MTEENFVNFVTTITKLAHIATLVYEAHKEYNRISRRHCVRPANLTSDEEEFFKTCVQQLKEKDEEHFFKGTRMSVGNFNLLLTMLKNKMERFSNRKAIDAETRLAVTITYLAHGCNVHIIAWAYKLAITTARKIIYETCDAIWDELHVVYLSPPNVSELKIISDNFYIKTGMPNCLGAIDAKLIKIVSPKKSGSKKSFSIVLMAACDANYVFTYVDVSALVSQSDGGILAQSDFGRKLSDGTLEVPCYSNLPGTSTNFPHYFVGNSTFPLKNNLMRPFPGHNLPPDKDRFNVILSKTREHIENAFGILANRWRVLHTMHMFPKNADKIVLATLVLHNFLMLQNDTNYFTSELVDHSIDNRDIEGQWRQEVHSLQSYQARPTNRSSTTAFELRNKLKEFFQ